MYRKDKKRALVLGQGGLAGSFSAGFVSELCRNLGHDYFDSVYCHSVGSTIGTFFVANQPDIIENTWRNHVHGDKLVKPLNFLKNKPTLDLDYLISLFKGEVARLDVDKVISSSVNLKYVVIDYNSGEILSMTPNKENIFDLMKATCSLPIISGPTKVGDRLFLDGAFVYGGLPILEEIAKQYDEVIVVLNYTRDHRSKLIWWPIINIFFPVASLFYPKKLRKVFKQRKDKREMIFECAEKNNNIKIILPKEFHLDFSGDSDHKSINNTFDLGQEAAKEFISTNKTYV